MPSPWPYVSWLPSPAYSIAVHDESGEVALMLPEGGVLRASPRGSATHDRTWFCLLARAWSHWRTAPDVMAPELGGVE
jgi:hypothetical protein